MVVLSSELFKFIHRSASETRPRLSDQEAQRVAVRFGFFDEQPAHLRRRPDAAAELIVRLESEEPAKRAIGVLEVLAALCSSDIHQQRLSSIDFSPEKMDDRSGKRLNTVIEYITQHQHRPILIDEMAEICNLSTPAFCRWFKQVFNCSFVTYMTERRIEAACHLLETSKLGVSIIGDRVGFESYSNFNRAFTKLKRLPPREYRRVNQ